jgi:hypothetical protein
VSLEESDHGVRRIIIFIIVATALWCRHAKGGGAFTIARMSTLLLSLLLLLLISPLVSSWTCLSWASRPYFRGRGYLHHPQQPRVVHPRTNFLVVDVRRRRRRTSTVLKTFSSSLFSSSPLFDGDDHSTYSSSSSSSSSIFKTTALAIVPPEGAWDTIQRARYMAGDPSYQQWPPCLRLFCYHHQNQQNARKSPAAATTDSGMIPQRITDDPLQIATVVEKYNIAPFTVRLNRWSILPHAEVILHEKQQQQQQQRRAGEVGQAQSTGTDTGSASTTTATPLSEFEKLVAQEEAIGRRNLKKRLQRKAEAAAAAAAATTTSSTTPSVAADARDDEDNDDLLGPTPSKNEKGKKQDKKKQRASTNSNTPEAASAVASFNGPCVICLEPDVSSKRRISKLRLRILQELVVANKHNDDDDDDSNNSITTSKIQHLQHVCSPTATVTPLDIMTKLDAATSAAAVTAAVASATTSSFTKKRKKDKDDDAVDADDKFYRAVVPIGSFPTVQQAVAVLGHLQALWDPLEFRVTDLQVVSCRTTLATAASSMASTTGRAGDALYSSSSAAKKQEQQEQVGCDALIMLQGQEVFMDAKLNAEMANFIATRGQMGGHEAASAAAKKGHVGDRQGLPPSLAAERIRIDDLDLADGDVSSLQEWLWQEEDDDKYDVGGVNHMDSLDQEDEDHDEGTVVVLGRTHFFTGDMRTYVGMPAESIPLRGSSSSSRAEKKSSRTNPTAQAIAAAAAAINDNDNGSWTSSTGNGTVPAP